MAELYLQLPEFFLGSGSVYQKDEKIQSLLHDFFASESLRFVC